MSATLRVTLRAGLRVFVVCIRGVVDNPSVEGRAEGTIRGAPRTRTRGGDGDDGPIPWRADRDLQRSGEPRVGVPGADDPRGEAVAARGASSAESRAAAWGLPQSTGPVLRARLVGDREPTWRPLGPGRRSRPQHLNRPPSKCAEERLTRPAAQVPRDVGSELMVRDEKKPSAEIR